MKDIFTVAKFTIKDMLSRKSFRNSTIFILLLIVLGFNVPNIINGVTGGEGLDNDTILIVDREHLLGKYSQENEQNTSEGEPQVWTQLSDEEIREKILNGDASAALVITKGSRNNNNINMQYIVKNRATSPAFDNELLLVIRELYHLNQLETQKGFSETDIQKLYPVISVGTEQIEEQEISGNIFVMMLMSLILFYAIYFCAFQVSSSITTEKTSKIIETLVTSTSPRNIVVGKTIGIGIVGLLQMLLFIGTAIICALLFLDHNVLATAFDLSQITPFLGLITILYFILGYSEFSFIYALTGSTVNKPEDIQSANAPVAIISMLGFYLAYFTLTDPTSSLNVFAAIFPISSPFCMPIRIMMGLATVPEILISIAVLVITILIIARVAIKIYSDAILNYGTKLSLSELIRMYKQK